MVVTLILSIARTRQHLRSPNYQEAERGHALHWRNTCLGFQNTSRYQVFGGVVKRQFLDSSSQANKRKFKEAASSYCQVTCKMKLPTKNAGKVVCVLSGLVLQTENNELCLASISKTFWMMFSHYNNKEKEQCAITAKILLHPCVFDGYQCCVPLSSQSCHFRVCDYKIVYACMADKMRYSFAPQSHIQESYSL